MRGGGGGGGGNWLWGSDRVLRPDIWGRGWGKTNTPSREVLNLKKKRN